MLEISQLTSEFELHRGQLKSFLLRISASVEDSEDIVQETYIKAFQSLEKFRGESSLKTWIFTIASNLAKDNLRVKRRWTENVTDMGKEAALSDRAFFQEAMHIRMNSPHGQFEVKEHITFCFTCISKSLPLEQQICLLLKEVHGFKVNEIAEITGVGEAMVKYYLHTSRSKMIEIFDGRCALINKKGVCHQCTELNGIFNPKQNAQEALAKIDLVKKAEAGDKEHLLDLRMQIVEQTDPFTSAAHELQLHHLQHNRQVMDKFFEKNSE